MILFNISSTIQNTPPIRPGGTGSRGEQLSIGASPAPRRWVAMVHRTDPFITGFADGRGLSVQAILDKITLGSEQTWKQDPH